MSDEAYCEVVKCADPGEPVYKAAWINLDGWYYQLDRTLRVTLCKRHWPKDVRRETHA